MADKKKVLIAEDDQLISKMYKTKLEADGYKVITADNGAAALEAVKSEKPDIILLDIIMPQLDGFSVLKELKSDNATKSIKVLMLTNLGTDEDMAKGKELGADDYIVKASMTPSQVSAEIKKHLT